MLSDLSFAEDVFVLGRDKDRNLTIDHGKVEYKGPSHLQRHHYMFITCGINKLGIGGPVIKNCGKVAGMFSLLEMAFIPSSIILKCLQMRKTFDCIPRLHLGMKFSAISFLDLPHREKIACKCDVNDGLIVKQVSEGSVAEKVGVRRGVYPVTAKDCAVVDGDTDDGLIYGKAPTDDEDDEETSTSVFCVELDSKVSGANSFGFFDELMASTASSDGCGMRLS
nr:unnamed protein product [Digitaria exilis]